MPTFHILHTKDYMICYIIHVPYKRPILYEAIRYPFHDINIIIIMRNDLHMILCDIIIMMLHMICHYAIMPCYYCLRYCYILHMPPFEHYICYATLHHTWPYIHTSYYCCLYTYICHIINQSFAIIVHPPPTLHTYILLLVTPILLLLYVYTYYYYVPPRISVIHAMFRQLLKLFIIHISYYYYPLFILHIHIIIITWTLH